jgi:glycosyltransferase involved in cell wall biosynthesis
MKILFLTSNDGITAGAVAIDRLQRALLKLEHKVLVFVGSSSVCDKTKKDIHRTALWRGLDWGTRKIGEAVSLSNLYRPSFRLWKKAIEDYAPDIIHIHWMYGAGGAVNIPLFSLPWISQNYPTVWTFHDMWGTTGGCTNSLDCERWKIGCGSCPQLKNSSSSSSIKCYFDTTSYMYRIKRAVYQRSRFSIICPSEWLANIARQSRLLVGKQIYCIPNILDTTQFRPLLKKSCRESLGIPEGKRVILFIGKPGNVFAYGDRVPIFVSAMKIIRKKYPDIADNIMLLVIGQQGKTLSQMVEYPAICIGAVTCPQLMALSYSATDLLVNTTQYDNFPGVIQESMACGTPAVVSSVGGIPEMVHHLKSGYLCKPDVPDEFAEGIKLLLTDNKLRSQLGEDASRYALEKYSEYTVVRQTIAKYKEMMNS